VRLAVRQLEGCIVADSAASYVELGQRASRHTHTVLSCTAGRPPVDRTGRCATATIGRAYHNPQTRALSFDMPQLLSPLCLHRGMPGSTARPSTAGAAGRTLLPGPTIQPPLLLLPWPVVGLFFLIL